MAQSQQKWEVNGGFVAGISKLAASLTNDTADTKLINKLAINKRQLTQ
jgi:hypothetical protein